LTPPTFVESMTPNRGDWRERRSGDDRSTPGDRSSSRITDLVTFDEIGKIAGCSRPYCVQTYLLGDTDA